MLHVQLYGERESSTHSRSRGVILREEKHRVTCTGVRREGEFNSQPVKGRHTERGRAWPVNRRRVVQTSCTVKGRCTCTERGSRSRGTERGRVQLTICAYYTQYVRIIQTLIWTP